MPSSFQEHGNEITEIISHKPPFIVRWGILLFFFLLVFIVCLSWFVKYPDIINTNAQLTSINAPKPVVTITNGLLTKLDITENQMVTKNQVLGFIESTANHHEILAISAEVDSIQALLNNNKSEFINSYFKNRFTQLGELQVSYQAYAQAFLNFKNYLVNGFYLHKRVMLRSDMVNFKKQHANLLFQKNLNEEDLVLSQTTFEANESLKNDSVISAFDYRIEKSKLINKKLTVPQITTAIITNEGQQNEKVKEIAELENTIDQQKTVFQQALNTFKSQVDEWKRKYLLVAPISGKVAFATFIQENQQLQVNQTICFINPENSLYYAQMVIPQANFGKVAIGQKVLLKFPSYPFQEYGSVTGEIEFVSHIPTDSGYLAKVVLTNGLNTNYKKQVQYRQGLVAKGEIVTKDLRLLQRFYYSIVKIISP